MFSGCQDTITTHKEQDQDIFNPDEMAVQNAIDLLKSKGYKIMKPKIEFEEV